MNVAYCVHNVERMAEREKEKDRERKNYKKKGLLSYTYTESPLAAQKWK
jgi:hypothetical protein